MLFNNLGMAAKFGELAKKGGRVYYRYEAVFITDKNIQLPVHNVSFLKISSNYLAKYTSDFIISVQVFKSTHQQLLQCNRNDLKMRLIAIPTSTTAKIAIGGTKIVNVYSAFLTDNSSESLKNYAGGLSGNYTDDLSNLIDLEVDLQNLGLLEFKLTSIGGVHRNSTLSNVMKGLMSTPIRSIDPSGQKGYDVDVIPPINDKVYFQIPIPAKVKLIDLPEYFQTDKQYGLYQSDVGYFLENNMWYIFPAFDYSRFSGKTKTLTIVVVPPNEMVGNDQSYIEDGQSIHIFATGNIDHKDNIERDLHRVGHGFRSTKAGNMVDHYTVMDKGNLSIPKGRNSVTIGLDNRPNTLINAPVVGDSGLSSNPWKDASNVISRLGTTMQLNWNASNHRLLRPGMPVKVVYSARGKLYSIFAILKGAETTIETRQKSKLDERYVSSTILVVHTEPPKDALN